MAETTTGANAYSVLGHPVYGAKLCVMVTNGEKIAVLANNDLMTDVHSMKQYLVTVLDCDWPTAAELTDRVKTELRASLKASA